MDLARSTAEQIGLEVLGTASGRCTYVAYDDLAQRAVLDRRTTNSTPGDGGVRLAPLEGDILRLRVFVDRGTVGVFLGDGAATVSSLSLPDDGTRTPALTAVAGTAHVTALRVHRLRSIWEDDREGG
ncbi:hypothetical protein MOPEL_009_00250 [Mobilicoccus pelagius NBRC 104925]|uniref:Glycosyl hydrolase family 32 C-terminal domain-containing protein n=1 Tax=Mobilicoccus pelagius NBRC 104925 TaxID=1089455 RepID=H5UNM7_9MICO|nr:hypothetical protein MOPEL_009_00250 [Mobilicoccus pelagius NBRC 104925]